MSEIHPRWSALLEWLRQKGMNAGSILVEARRTEGESWIWALCSSRDPPLNTSLSGAGKGNDEYSYSSWIISKGPAPTDGDANHDTVFGPYISILPSNFDAHPLTWLIRPRDPRTEEQNLDIGHDLLEHTPKGVLNTLESVAIRFRQDWERVCQYLRDNPALLSEANKQGRMLQPLGSSVAEQEFLWGWLNVNTRCIYHRLCPTRQDLGNMTMCPILDFANHTSDLPRTYPKPSKAEIWDQAPSRAFGDDFVLLSSKDKTLYPGEEVFLRYGAHSNRTLFTEYGFIGDLDTDAVEHGHFDCEADITWRMLRLFATRGAIGTWIEQLLRSTGYWGEWTIHSAPEPAHPSFRLISALRLYHSIPQQRIMPPHEDHETVRTWRDTISGQCDAISPVNESAWRETLNKLCLGIDNETGVYLDNLNKVGREWPVDSWVHYMRRCLLMLWREQQHAAWCVHQSLEEGKEF